MREGCASLSDLLVDSEELVVEVDCSQRLPCGTWLRVVGESSRFIKSAIGCTGLCSGGVVSGIKVIVTTIKGVL